MKSYGDIIKISKTAHRDLTITFNVLLEYVIDFVFKLSFLGSSI